jgi:hypothetical protein
VQAVVSLLLSSGANPNAADNLGSSALLEAVKAGQAGLLALLVEAGAGLQLSNSELASALCSMVVEGQEGLLRSYIAAGANVSSSDYNQQTPLHVAAVHGKLHMVSGLAVPRCLPAGAGVVVVWCGDSPAGAQQEYRAALGAEVAALAMLILMSAVQLAGRWMHALCCLPLPCCPARCRCWLRRVVLSCQRGTGGGPRPWTRRGGWAQQTWQTTSAAAGQQRRQQQHARHWQRGRAEAIVLVPRPSSSWLLLQLLFRT